MVVVFSSWRCVRSVLANSWCSVKSEAAVHDIHNSFQRVCLNDSRWLDYLSDLKFRRWKCGVRIEQKRAHRSRKHAEEEGWQNDPAGPKYEGEANLVFS